MSKIKYTQKELKRPDKFREILVEWVAGSPRYFNKILLSVVVVAVGLVGSYLVYSYSEKQNSLASERFLQALENYGNGEMKKSLSQLKKLRKEYPKAEVSTTALYQIGMINYRMGNFKEAAKNLKLFLNKDVDDAVVRDSVNLVIGLSDFQLKKWDRSVAYLSKINDRESPYYAQARRHLGIIYEKKGEKKKAEKIWMETISETLE